MSDDPVLLDIDKNVATITLNQPNRMNALSGEIISGIRSALDDIDDIDEDDEDDPRCIVITGAGGAFSAGGDIARMRNRVVLGNPSHESAADLERLTNQFIPKIVNNDLPVVAKIDGPAVGAGASLAIACDFQLASEESLIGFAFRQVGLSVDSGVSYLLPRIVGENIAKELIFTGELLEADRAAELGLFNHVFSTDEFDDRVDEFVEAIATGPTVALGHAKRLIGSGLEKSLDMALRDEALAQGIVYATADHQEGVEAFMEGRDPNFMGR